VIRDYAAPEDLGNRSVPVFLVPVFLNPSATLRRSAMIFNAPQGNTLYTYSKLHEWNLAEE